MTRKPYLHLKKRVFSREVGSLVRGDLKKEEISLVFLYEIGSVLGIIFYTSRLRLVGRTCQVIRTSVG